MKISLNWLKQYIKTDLSAEEIGVLLTDGGLEVESIEKFESIKGGLKGLIVGEVKTCEKHPDADRLSLTTVNIGQENLLNIVCGAPNVAAGQKVIVATIGANLYPSEGESFEIKKSKIRGAVSEGMLCAEDEIGLGKSHAGIMVLPTDTPVGLAASEYFKVENDFVYEIGLTPNRTDAISHLGVARDLSALLLSRKNLNAPVQLPDVTTYLTANREAKINNVIGETELGTKNINVTVEDTELCPRYSGLNLTGVKVGSSPEWLVNRLASIGIKSINNIVDITNFVMHETGQPLHAFDANKIKGDKVIVKALKAETKFITLDSAERKLSGEELMICDTEKPMCIAGVFGGLDSGISESTVNVFLESAYFNPVSVRKTARNHGLKTDSAFRFERGTDPNNTLFALKRAASLICEVSGGNVVGEIIDIYPAPIQEKTISINYIKIDKYIGKVIEREKINSILISLGITILNETDGNLLLSVPTYKTDVTNEADIVEEVLRIYGYNNVEIPSKINASINNAIKPDPTKIQNSLSDLLTSRGFSEIMTLSLTQNELNQKIGIYNQETSIEILNPVSNEVNMLRQNLLTGLLQSISYNLNRKQNNLKFYEFGKTYHKTEKGFVEDMRLFIGVTGFKTGESWSGKQEKTDLYLVKDAVVTLLRKVGVTQQNLSFTETPLPGYAYSFNLQANKRNIGTIGAVNKTALKALDINQDVFIADLSWKELIRITAKQKTMYTEISKYPEVRRDLALLVDKKTTFAELQDLALQAERKLIKDINLFDIYEGDKIAPGKKSYAISFTLLDNEATLTDKQIEKVMDKLVSTYKEKAGAELRQ